jgi:FtsH-binding integral membrane protein
VSLSRLAGAAVLSFAATLFVVGTGWDIQWHSAVGRDKVLTPPHTFMLAGIILLGLVSLGLILLDTWRAHRGAGVDDGNSSRMLRVFQAPVGLAVTGVGALLAALAFPLDDYWHTLYGIDVVLLAPFHVMLGFSVILAELGVLFLLASEANRRPEGRGKLAVQAGFAAQMGVTLTTMLIYAVQGDSPQGLGQAGSYSYLIYPIILALVLPIGLLTALWATRRPGAASVAALTVLAIRQIMYIVLPGLMDQAVASEGLSYRPNAPDFMVTPYAFPGGILLLALVLDGVYWLVRRRGMATGWPLAGAAFVLALVATVLDQPWVRVLVGYYYRDMNAQAMWWATLPLTLGAAVAGIALAALASRSLSVVRQ